MKRLQDHAFHITTAAPFARVLLLLGLMCLNAWPVQAQPAPLVELTQTRQQQIVDELRLSGTVTALKSSRLSVSVSGLITERNVDVGQPVQAGALLFALDDEKARLNLVAADARVQEAESLLQEARRRLDEALSVGAGQNIAATEVGARRSQVAIAESTLARLQAERALQQTIIARHRIYAPFSGVVSTRSRDVGEWVDPGDELVLLVDHDHLRVDVPVPQELYAAVTGGAELQITAPGRSTDTPLSAAIDIVVPVSDLQARTFLIRSVPTAAEGLIPGMSVQALLRIPTAQAGLSIPRDALNRYPDGRVTVWLAQPGSEGFYTVRERRVTVESRFAANIVIKGGLQDGDLVVTRGNEALQEGMRVRVDNGVSP